MEPEGSSGTTKSSNNDGIWIMTNIVISFSVFVLSLILLLFLYQYVRRRLLSGLDVRQQQQQQQSEGSSDTPKLSTEERAQLIKEKLKLVEWTRARSDSVTARSTSSSELSSSTRSDEAKNNNNDDDDDDGEEEEEPRSERLADDLEACVITRSSDNYVESPDTHSGSTHTDVLDKNEENVTDVLDKNEENVLLCSICLVEFADHELLSVSNNVHCRHLFHQICIVSWCLKNDGCPVCRRPYLDIETRKEEV